MKPSEALAKHLACRPQMPRPFDPASPEAASYQQALQVWVTTKEGLDVATQLEGIQIVTTERQQPTCAPRADYGWRDIPTRKTKATRPRWSGATKEYNREKQAERRAKIRQAVLEVQAERDGRAS